jgi:phage terminase small subunit
MTIYSSAEMGSTMALTDKRRRFVDEYLVDLCGAQAAIRAGYAPGRAKQTADDLLNVPEVAAAVAEGQAALASRTHLTQDWVLERLKEVAERSLQHEAVLDHNGEPTGEYTFQHSGANRALELIGKHLGMFKERVEVTGKNGGPVETDTTVRVEFVRPKKDANDPDA